MTCRPRFFSRLVGALLCLACGAGFAAASVADSDWALPLKVRGAAAKVGALKADGPYDLRLEATGFTLSSQATPGLGFSGTYADEGGKLVFTATNGLDRFVHTLIEAAAVSRGKVADVTAVAITKFSSSGSSEKQSWAAQTLTLSWKVSFTFSGVVDAKAATNAKGSLTISGKGTDGTRGIAADLAGSTWDLSLKETVTLSRVGTDTWTSDPAPALTFGPAPDLALEANHFQINWGGDTFSGSYQITPKGLDCQFDEPALRAFLADEVSWILQDHGTDATSVEIATPVTQKISITVVRGKMTVGATIGFNGSAEVGGETVPGSGSYKIKGTGIRR